MSKRKGPPEWLDIIAERMKAQGWTLRELAERADVSPASLSLYLSRKRGLTSGALERLARTLKLDLRPSD